MRVISLVSGSMYLNCFVIQCSGVSLVNVWLTPAQLQFPTAVCSGIPQESSVMAWTVRRLYPVSRDIATNRFTKENVADHVQLPTYHIFQVYGTHAIIMLNSGDLYIAHSLTAISKKK